MTSLNWKLRHERSEPEKFSLSGKKALRPECGFLDFERVEIVPGLVANLANIESRKALDLMANLEHQRDRVAIQIVLAGQTALEFRDGVSSVLTASRPAIYAARGTDVTFGIPAGSKLRTLTITYCPEKFMTRLGQDLPQDLQTILHDPACPNAILNLHPQAISRIAELAFLDRHTGALREMQLDGISRLLLASVLGQLEGLPQNGCATTVSPRLRDRLFDLRDRIFEDPSSLPSLEDLAQDAGVDPKRLNAGFKELFGATIFQFWREHRLDCARSSLRDGGVLVKEAAHIAGYAHVSNFVTAYRRRFGVSPGVDAKPS